MSKQRVLFFTCIILGCAIFLWAVYQLYFVIINQHKLDFSKIAIIYSYRFVQIIAASLGCYAGVAGLRYMQAQASLGGATIIKRKTYLPILTITFSVLLTLFTTYYLAYNKASIFTIVHILNLLFSFACAMTSFLQLKTR